MPYPEKLAVLGIGGGGICDAILAHSALKTPSGTTRY
jgi:hypothetical protein